MAGRATSALELMGSDEIKEVRLKYSQSNEIKHNISFERDVCYAAAPHTPLKLGVRDRKLYGFS